MSDLHIPMFRPARPMASAAATGKAMYDLPIPMLGYDARLMSTQADSSPWSADAGVWLSITEEDGDQTWEGFQNLWCKLADLVRRTMDVNRTSEYQLVGIARINPVFDVGEDEWSFYANRVYTKSHWCEVEPYFAQTAWRLEGYDVCSYYLWSGLHRASYAPDDKRSRLVLAQQRLNPRGLLSEFEFARRLALEMTYSPVSEEPYFPYAVFSLPWP